MVMIKDIQSVKDIIDAVQLDREQVQELIRHLTYGPTSDNYRRNPIEYRYNCLNCGQLLFVSYQMVENFFHIKVNCFNCHQPLNTVHTTRSNIPE